MVNFKVPDCALCAEVAARPAMSVSPPKADIDWKLSHVHFVPEAIAIFGVDTIDGKVKLYRGVVQSAEDHGTASARGRRWRADNSRFKIGHPQVCVVSALTPKADINRAACHVCFVPIATFGVASVMSAKCQI